MTGGAETVRIHRRPFLDGNFVQLPNESVRDPRLSLRARAVYALVMSRPPTWITSAARIAAEVPDGIWVVRSAFRELETYGYLRRKVVRGPRGRLATELHFYDIPAGDTDCRSAASRSTDAPVTDAPVTEKPVTDAPGTERPGTDAPGTERPGTERPGTERPGTERPGTEKPVSSRSLPRPSTKTRTNTGQKDRSLSLGEMLRAHLPDMADAERDRLGEFMVSGCSDGRKRRAYLRTIIKNGDLPAHLAEFQGNGAQPAQDRPAAGTRQGPDCPHGQPDGAGINPRSGEPWCPMCRMEARELMPGAQS